MYVLVLLVLAHRHGAGCGPERQRGKKVRMLRQTAQACSSAAPTSEYDLGFAAARACIKDADASIFVRRDERFFAGGRRPGDALERSFPVWPDFPHGLQSSPVVEDDARVGSSCCVRRGEGHDIYHIWHLRPGIVRRHGQRRWLRRKLRAGNDAQRRICDIARESRSRSHNTSRLSRQSRGEQATNAKRPRASRKRMSAETLGSVGELVFCSESSLKANSDALRILFC